MGLENDCPYIIGRGRRGKLNLITDVPGVKVGHVTVSNGYINTGVTAVLPHGGNLFKEKVPAGCAIINGFGKTVGLMQVNEIGTIETPIILTNTLSVGIASSGLIRYMLERNPEIGVSTGTVNPIVVECNDGPLSDLRGLHIKEEYVYEAIENAGTVFEEGCVGGGTGMRTMGIKAGIGSSSRIVELEGKEYTLGCLVQSNFGAFGDLVIGGDPVGQRIADAKNDAKKDRGSIIIILATDIPMSDRQLRRVSMRAAAGIGRMGGYYSNGSGDIAIAFSTANRIPHEPAGCFINSTQILDDYIDPVFKMAAEAVEEAITSALWHAETMKGRDGNVVRSLRDYLGDIEPEKLGLDKKENEKTVPQKKE